VFSARVHVWSQVPGNVEAVLAHPMGNISYQRKSGLQRNDPAVVGNRSSKPAVTVMSAKEEIEGFPRNPVLGL
jgi:hypothetical protein